MRFCPKDTFLNDLACGLVAGPTILLHLNAITHRGPLKWKHQHRISQHLINQENKDQIPCERLSEEAR